MVDTSLQQLPHPSFCQHMPTLDWLWVCSDSVLVCDSEDVCALKNLADKWMWVFVLAWAHKNVRGLKDRGSGFVLLTIWGSSWIHKRWSILRWCHSGRSERFCTLLYVLFSVFRDLEGNQIQTLNYSILKTCSKLEVLWVTRCKTFFML